MIWKAAVSPALIVCAAGEAVIAKSTTCTDGCTTLTELPPFALAVPDIERGFGTVIGTAGVMSTSTVATAFTASVGILHEITDP